MREEDNKDIIRKIDVLNLKVQIIIWSIIPITIALLIIMYCCINTYRIQKKMEQEKPYTQIYKSCSNEDNEDYEIY